MATPPTSYGGYGGNANEKPKYAFEYPMGWKTDTINKVEKGTQGIDGRVYNPRNKQEQVFVITLSRLGEDANFALRDIDSTFAGFAGADYDLQDALTVATNRTSGTRTKDGQQYFDVEIDSPDVTYLSSITVAQGKVYAMFVKSPTKAFRNNEGKYRDIVQSFRLFNTKTLQAMLQMIKTDDKQNCVVVGGSDGLSLRMQDDSKTMQAQIFLKSQLFGGYACTRMVEFGLPLRLLLDTIGIFATLVGSQIDMHFPGPNRELIIRTHEDALCSYAQLASIHTPQQHDDLAAYWSDPSSTILSPGHLLKEAVEDLEWPGGDVVVRLTSTPLAAVLSSRGPNGALQVSLPLGDQAQLTLAAREVCHRYAYRHMAAALANLPATRDQQHIQSKVSIDANGLMRVQHMVPAGGLGGGQPAATQAMAVVTVYITPRDEDDEDPGDEYGGVMQGQ